MRKKLIAGVLAASMMAAILTGCGKAGSEDEATVPVEETVTTGDVGLLEDGSDDTADATTTETVDESETETEEITDAETTTEETTAEVGISYEEMLESANQFVCETTDEDPDLSLFLSWEYDGVSYDSPMDYFVLEEDGWELYSDGNSYVDGDTSTVWLSNSKYMPEYRNINVQDNSSATHLYYADIQENGVYSIEYDYQADYDYAIVPFTVQGIGIGSTAEEIISVFGLPAYVHLHEGYEGSIDPSLSYVYDLSAFDENNVLWDVNCSFTMDYKGIVTGISLETENF